MEEKKLYLVHSALLHDKTYGNGDKVHLTEAEAAPLLDKGVVTLHEADESPETDDVPLTSLKVADLKELAAKMNLAVANNATKDALIAAIAEARAAAEQK